MKTWNMFIHFCSSSSSWSLTSRVSIILISHSRQRVTLLMVEKETYIVCFFIPVAITRWFTTPQLLLCHLKNSIRNHSSLVSWSLCRLWKTKQRRYFHSVAIASPSTHIDASINSKTTSKGSWLMAHLTRCESHFYLIGIVIVGVIEKQALL